MLVWDGWVGGGPSVAKARGGLRAGRLRVAAGRAGAVGCVWAFGGFVPKECAAGGMGSAFAFNTMWCAISPPPSPLTPPP